MLRTIFLRAGVASWLVLSCAALAAAQPAGTEPGSGLTLERALALALDNNPELTAFSAAVRAREAETLQAGLRPNPVLSAEVENLAGSGELAGTDAAETTVALSQRLELGGKRSHRRDLAAAEADLARSEYAQARADVLGRTTRQFVAVLAAQERRQLAGELVALARQSLATVQERIEGGKAAATEAVRARILLAELQTAQGRRQHELAAARRQLAALLGAEELAFERLSGDLSRLPHLPGREELLALVADSPRTLSRAADLARRGRALELERARRIPDLEVTVGARHDNDLGDTALVAGISLPLPLFDRNQGNVAAARSRLEEGRADALRDRLAVRSALTTAWQEMSAAHEEAEALRDTILPAAREAFAAAEYGYRAGKFGLLDVLDAQRTLVEARERYLTALADFHRAAADIERLLGRELPTLALDTTTDTERNAS